MASYQKALRGKNKEVRNVEVISVHGRHLCTTHGLDLGRSSPVRPRTQSDALQSFTTYGIAESSLFAKSQVLTNEA
jgi:hypothetical protein